MAYEPTIKIFKHHGTFTPYKPDFDRLPRDHVWRKLGNVQFLKNEKGLDWYAFAHLPANKPMPGRRFVAVDPATHRVSSVGDDAEAMFPAGMMFIETSLAVEMGDRFDPTTKTFVSRKAQKLKVAAAKAQKGPIDVA